MTTQLDIEKPGVLTAYLIRKDLIAYEEEPEYTVLTGGVSNRTVLVKRTPGHSFVIKQSLYRLRVETEWLCDPSRIEREALALEHLPALLGTDRTPALRFYDAENHILVMDAVEEPFINWKTYLLNGNVEPATVTQFSEILSSLHRTSLEQKEQLQPVFHENRFFVDLRIRPYYEYPLEIHPGIQDWMNRLIDETLQTRVCLVHGDYSPKNLLLKDARLILLDHEVIHWGDPAFDVGFSLTHLLSKAHYLAEDRQRFHDSAHAYWSTYRTAVPALIDQPGTEVRCVRHTLACLLARVDGRSPLEYLDGWQRKTQRDICLNLIPSSPDTIPELIDAFISQLG